MKQLMIFLMIIFSVSVFAQPSANEILKKVDDNMVSEYSDSHK